MEDKVQITPTEKYRILMVTGIYPTQARPHSGTFVKALVDSLIAAGHEVEVIHPKPGPVAVRYASATFQVFWRTLTSHFDIVHGHYGLWCLAARMQWSTAVVAAYLGDDLLGTVMENGKYSRKSLFVAGISRWLCHHVEAVTVKSEQMKKASHYEQSVVIPDGINFSLFQPLPRMQARQELGWDQNRYYVVFANNPAIPVKNFSLAQSSIAHLQHKGIAVELVVANSLPQAKVAQYINASNALILTSIAEGSPNVVKEAMACNIPVVATDVGDVADVIKHTAGCSLCPPDVDALAAGLEKALLYSQRTSGRADISHLASNIIVKQVLALYQQAIIRKTKRHNKAISTSIHV